MNCLKMNCLKLVMILLIPCASALAAAQGERSSQAEAPVRKAIESLVAAFNRGDARAVAALFTENAEHVGEDAEVTRGRAAIEKGVAETFAESEGLQLAATITSIRFPRPDIAQVRGAAVTTIAGSAPAQGGFTAILVRSGADWKVDSLEESVAAPAATAAQRLEELAWLTGEWVDEGEGTTVRTLCEWSATRTFLTRTFTVAIKGQIDLQGTQVIGWDPSAGRIRSWVFDSDGGFSEEVWSRQGNRWTITSAGVLPDGRRASAVNVMTRVNENQFTWQSTERDAGGELLPDVKPITVKRKGGG